MLVLTRKEKQSIQIGDGIQIVITKIRGNTVQVGIEAPDDVSIVRSELTFRDDPKQLKKEPRSETKSNNSQGPDTTQHKAATRSAEIPALPTPADVHNRLKDEDFLGIRDLPRLRIVRPVEQNDAPLGSFMKSH
ncbi:MAG: carbon storage regulator [Pirellulaceae bacterium]